ncbi:lipopolysaccharide assembly protein LapA domain-containing protein [Rhabdothermincola sediminis]|uniref:lipopolysaccharide assembly protein LapA domain-containing protein n=1 Tax=Rhabdothermincola sediminis TaxID=2751370 RepID=UPI001AA02D1F|nr:lipopolysaccharide assembly protein LapA domain-containing protein [Rhabdothermincola sediminis]
MAREAEHRGAKMQVDARLVGGAVILLALLAFVGQNREEVPFTFLFLQFTAPLWLMLAGTVVLALLVGFLAGRRSRRPKR